MPQPGRTLLLVLLVRSGLTVLLGGFYVLLVPPVLLIAGLNVWLQLRLVNRPRPTAEAVISWLFILLTEILLTGVAVLSLSDFGHPWDELTAGRDTVAKAGIILQQVVTNFYCLPFLLPLPFVLRALLRTCFPPDALPAEPEKWWLGTRERRVAQLLLAGHVLLACSWSLSSLLLVLLALCYFYLSTRAVTWRYAVGTCGGSLLVCGGLNVAAALLVYLLAPGSEGRNTLLLLAGLFSPLGQGGGAWWFWALLPPNVVGAAWLLRRLWQWRTGRPATD